jgi:Kef-type K+ transport system membrane component KefB
LGVAVLEDIVLWLALAMATALAGKNALDFWHMTYHLTATVAYFVPIYFAIVGLKLDLIHGLSLWMITVFLMGSCLVKILSVSLAGRFAGFRGLDLVNLAITANARGGPGIVLASVAFDAGIISPKFYTTLVIAAVLTSQARAPGSIMYLAEVGRYLRLWRARASKPPSMIHYRKVDVLVLSHIF